MKHYQPITSHNESNKENIQGVQEDIQTIPAQEALEAGKDSLAQLLMKFTLWYPAKPFQLNQAWGIYNPAYLQFGFSKHNGIDIALGGDERLYAPCDGIVVRTGDQPTGGGIFLGLMAGPYDFPEGAFWVLLDFLHCEELLVKEGQKVKTGDVLAIADNTGFSTGPHTHMQPRRVAYWNLENGSGLAFATADTNDANDSFDPLPYFNGFYAKDAQTVIGAYVALISTLRALVEALSAKQ